MNSRPRICHLAATGEGATWMVEQLRELRDVKGYDVSAIIANVDGELATKLKKNGIPFHRFDFEFPSMSGWGSLVSRVINLARLLRRERYDVVQTHLFATMVLGRLSAWLADVPVRLAMIAGPYHLEAHTPRWIDAATCWMETGIIASCEYTRSLYRDLGVRKSRLSLIYYGPDEAKFETAVKPADLRVEFGLPPETQLVGMVAYFYPRLPPSLWTPSILHNRVNKRQEDLIRATPAILREFPNARILLVGNGWTEAGEKEVENAKALVETLGLTGKVIFVGFRSDVNNVLAALDVAVQASLSENLGGTIESLLMRCPTVATRTGGLVDSIKDGATGVLVEPLDPGSLAEGVRRMLRDPVDARRLAAAGRARMLERFTLTQTIDTLDVLYRRQLAGRWLWSRRGYRPYVSLLRALMAPPLFAYLAVRLAWDVKQRPSAFLLRLRMLRLIFAHLAVRLVQVPSRLARRRPLPFRKPALPRIQVPQIRLQKLQPWPVHVRPLRLRPIQLTPLDLVRGLEIRQTLRSGVTRSLTWMRLQPLYAYGYARYLLRDTVLLERWSVFFDWIRGRKKGLT